LTFKFKILNRFYTSKIKAKNCFFEINIVRHSLVLSFLYNDLFLMYSNYGCKLSIIFYHITTTYSDLFHNLLILCNKYNIKLTPFTIYSCRIIFDFIQIYFRNLKIRFILFYCKINSFMWNFFYLFLKIRSIKFIIYCLWRF
jgi:hypothetical protein